MCGDQQFGGLGDFYALVLSPKLPNTLPEHNLQSILLLDWTLIHSKGEKRNTMNRHGFFVIMAKQSYCKHKRVRLSLQRDNPNNEPKNLFVPQF